MDPFLNQILKEKAEQNHATTIHQKSKGTKTTTTWEAAP
jgi:hypothetical protein